MRLCEPAALRANTRARAHPKPSSDTCVRTRSLARTQHAPPQTRAERTLDWLATAAGVDVDGVGACTGWPADPFRPKSAEEGQRKDGPLSNRLPDQSHSLAVAAAVAAAAGDSNPPTWGNPVATVEAVPPSSADGHFTAAAAAAAAAAVEGVLRQEAGRLTVALVAAVRAAMAEALRAGANTVLPTPPPQPPQPPPDVGKVGSSRLSDRKPCLMDRERERESANGAF